MYAQRALFWSVVIAAFAVCSNSFAAPITLIDEDFDNQNAGVGALNFNNLTANTPNFSVSNGTVDLIGNGFFDFIPGNGLYLDLDGSTNDAGDVQSDVLTLNPGTYTLTFSLAGSTRTLSPVDSVTVSIAGVFSQLFTLPFTQDTFLTQTINFSIAAATNGSLLFSAAGGDDRGLLLDNINLQFTPAAAAVPEPASIALWGLGALGVTAAGRRRKRLRTIAKKAA